MTNDALIAEARKLAKDFRSEIDATVTLGMLPKVRTVDAIVVYFESDEQGGRIEVFLEKDSGKFITATLSPRNAKGERLNPMPQKLSIFQRIICCLIALGAAGLYVGFYFYTASLEWAAKEGDRSPLPAWFPGVVRDLILFPFGFVPPLLGVWSFVLNLLFWSAAGVAIYILSCRRRLRRSFPQD